MSNDLYWALYLFDMSRPFLQKPPFTKWTHQIDVSEPKHNVGLYLSKWNPDFVAYGFDMQSAIYVLI